jgi:hypothetical protein
MTKATSWFFDVDSAADGCLTLLQIEREQAHVEELGHVNCYG